MRHLKALGVMLVATLALGLTALGMTATSAFALPDVSLLSGETFPLDWHFADNGTTPWTIANAGGRALEGKGYEELELLAKSSALGILHELVLNAVELGTENECHTEGDAAGEVLKTGEWHLVPITTTPTLTMGIAYLFTNLDLLVCHTIKISIRGCALASSSATENGIDLTETTTTHGANEKGQDLLREYINDSGEKVKCVLTMEIIGTKKSVEGGESVNEGKAITLGIPSTGSAKMFEFSGL